MQYKCPCCGYYTYPLRPDEDDSYVCPVCYWENDPALHSIYEPSVPNRRISMQKARLNFKAFGASLRELLPYVRLPSPEEKTGNR